MLPTTLRRFSGSKNSEPSSIAWVFRTPTKKDGSKPSGPPSRKREKPSLKASPGLWLSARNSTARISISPKRHREVGEQAPPIGSMLLGVGANMLGALGTIATTLGAGNVAWIQNIPLCGPESDRGAAVSGQAQGTLQAGRDSHALDPFPGSRCRRDLVARGAGSSPRFIALICISISLLPISSG